MGNMNTNDTNTTCALSTFLRELKFDSYNNVKGTVSMNLVSKIFDTLIFK